MIIGERLKKYIKDRGFTARAFADLAGVSEGMVYKYYKMDSVEIDTIKNWAHIFGISFLDLLDPDDSNRIIAAGELDDSLVLSPGSVPGFKELPLIPLSARGVSFNEFLMSSIKKRNYEQIVSPVSDADFVITVTGESMSPEYPNGSQLVIKKIDQAFFIEWGNVYVLDTPNGPLIKRVLKGPDEDHITCASISRDPAFAPFEVAICGILGFYRILLCMTIK